MTISQPLILKKMVMVITMVLLVKIGTQISHGVKKQRVILRLGANLNTNGAMSALNVKDL